MTLKEIFIIVTEGSARYPYDNIAGIRVYTDKECTWRICDEEYSNYTYIKDIRYDEELRIEEDGLHNVHVLQFLGEGGYYIWEYDVTNDTGNYGMLSNNGNMITMLDAEGKKYIKLIKTHEETGSIE